MSEFSRETLLNIIETDHVQCGEASALARMALAAMDSESGCLPLDYLQGHKDGLEWAAQLAEANHPETGDWLYDDPIELAKAIRKGPDMPPAQPVADSEPVAYIFKHPAGRLFWALTDESNKGQSDVMPVYAEPQPAPVVPQDVLDALQKVARIRLDMNDFDGDRRGIADCLGDAEEALIEVVNRRAAMLHAGTLTNEGTIQAVNSPVIPGWIPVSEQMPPSRHEVLVGRWWGEKPRWCCKWATYIPGHPDAQSSGWLIPGASWTPTHWMPLPAAPQEPKP
ncbi:DUF551 domain-containing protein [Klebsiella quasipneumoniae]|uniref:DUF551 domain-containing protein n=1 Tax=Klebsiella quasipneumoniae TaxID=1463165 RepID=UPI000983871F|nr:DUF551 domain-containing protein [Klebsiella quasipneumoniae]GKP57884.1 hypothetical protein NUKP47_01840 [Klebsiella quasipneumoniae]